MLRACRSFNLAGQCILKTWTAICTICIHHCLTLASCNQAWCNSNSESWCQLQHEGYMQSADCRSSSSVTHDLCAVHWTCASGFNAETKQSAAGTLRNYAHNLQQSKSSPYEKGGGIVVPLFLEGQGIPAKVFSGATYARPSMCHQICI